MANGTDLAKAYVQIIPSTEGMTKNLTAALGGEMDAAGSSIGSRLGSAIGTGLKVAGAATAAAGAATVAFAKSAVDAGQDFDAAMSQVQATLLADKEDMAELRDFAQEMGASTVFSATQAAEA